MLGSFRLFATNFPEGTYAWTIMSYDQATQQWRYWESGIPIDQSFDISNIELNGYWVLVRAQPTTPQQLGPYGPFNLSDGGIYTINAMTGALTEGYPPAPSSAKAQIQTISYPNQASPGTTVQVSVLVKNVGGVDAYITVWGYPAWWGDIYPIYTWLPAGQPTYFNVSFTMPDYDLQFNVVAGHYDFDIPSWVQDELKGPFTIAAGVSAQVKSLEVAYAKV